MSLKPPARQECTALHDHVTPQRALGWYFGGSSHITWALMQLRACVCIYAQEGEAPADEDEPCTDASGEVTPDVWEELKSVESSSSRSCSSPWAAARDCSANTARLSCTLSCLPPSHTHDDIVLALFFCANCSQAAACNCFANTARFSCTLSCLPPSHRPSVARCDKSGIVSSNSAL